MKKAKKNLRTIEEMLLADPNTTNEMIADELQISIKEVESYFDSNDNPQLPNQELIDFISEGNQIEASDAMRQTDLDCYYDYSDKRFCIEIEGAGHSFLRAEDCIKKLLEICKEHSLTITL